MSTATAEDTDDKAIDVEFELENEDTEGTVSAVADANPNIDDQLQATENTDDQTEDKRTPEQRMDEFSKSDPELESYGNKVKKRIKKLTFQKGEEERQKEAAITYAANVKKENNRLKAQQVINGSQLLNEQRIRLKAELAQGTALLKEAQTLNDGDLLAEATQNLSRYNANLAQVENAIGRTQKYIKDNKLQAVIAQTIDLTEPQFTSNLQPVTQPQQRTQPAQTTEVEPDEDAEAWAEENKWFGDDQVMTNAALTIHNQLVGQEGYIPNGEAYYDELNVRMRKNFPSKFKPATQTRSPTAPNTQVVAGGGNGGSARRAKKNTVQLTPSQVSVAKRLGVPLEEYAKQVYISNT